MKVTAVLVPVAVRPSQDGRGAQFRAVAPGEDWLEGVVKENPDATAAELPSRMPALQEIVSMTGAPIEPVTFTASSGRVTLVYTVALPMGIAADDVEVLDSWVDLVDPAEPAAEARRVGVNLISVLPHARDVVEYWRQRLEQTCALWGFLGEYFTARQARDVYSSVWGYEQDADGFGSWSGIDPKQRPGVFSADISSADLDESLISAKVMASLSRRDRPDFPMAMMLSKQLARGAISVGTGAALSAVVGPIPRLMPIVGAAVGAVAYRRRGRGKPPLWFHRTTVDPDVHRHLDRLYTPRPAWAYGDKPQAV